MFSVVTPMIWVSPRWKIAEPCTRGRISTMAVGKPFAERADEVNDAYQALTKHTVRQRVLSENVRNLLLELEHVQRGDAHDLGLAALEDRRAMHARQDLRLAVAGEVQALHAPLQLPAVLHRRDRPRGLAQAPLELRASETWRIA
jgi:hypothetical protein